MCYRVIELIYSHLIDAYDISIVTRHFNFCLLLHDSFQDNDRSRRSEYLRVNFDRESEIIKY